MNQTLVGIAEIAQMGKVKTQAIVHWRNRYDDFPKPIASLKMGPVFDRSQVEEWLEKNRKAA